MDALPIEAAAGAGPVATPLDASAGMAKQKIPLGPVAAMVAVKQLGTNGGGWYGPNSAVPLENPTPLSNALELVGILLINNDVLETSYSGVALMGIIPFAIGALITGAIAGALSLNCSGR